MSQNSTLRYPSDDFACLSSRIASFSRCARFSSPVSRSKRAAFSLRLNSFAFWAFSRSISSTCCDRLVSSRASWPTPTATKSMYTLRSASTPNSSAVPSHVYRYATAYVNAYSAHAATAWRSSKRIATPTADTKYSGKNGLVDPPVAEMNNAIPIESSAVDAMLAPNTRQRLYG